MLFNFNRVNRHEWCIRLKTSLLRKLRLLGKTFFLRKKCDITIFLFSIGAHERKCIQQLEDTIQIFPFSTGSKKKSFSHVDKLCSIFTAIVILIKHRRIITTFSNPLHHHQAFTVCAFIIRKQNWWKHTQKNTKKKHVATQKKYDFLMTEHVTPPLSKCFSASQLLF